MSTYAALLAEIAANFPDNTVGAITPALARAAYLDMIAGATPDQVITAAGTVTVADTDRLILVNKGVLSNTPFAIPLADDRDYLPLVVVDISGNGGDFTFTPASGTINGLPTFGATSTGPGYPFKVTLRPFTGIGWAAS